MPRAIDFHVHLPTTEFMQVTLGPYAKAAERFFRTEVKLKDIEQIAADYAELDRVDDSLKELNLAMTLRANEASILYNAACTFALLKKKAEAMDALRKAWEAGFKDSTWARRDPDLSLLYDEPEFNRLYPPQKLPLRTQPRAGD